MDVMTDFELDIYYQIEKMVADFDVNIDSIRKLLHDVSINRNFGEQLIYSDIGMSNNRQRRMLLFVVMLNESSNLQEDWHTAYYLLKEAYLMSDNIYAQLLNNPYDFDLHLYLRQMQKHIDVNKMMEEEELDFLNSMTYPVTVYRGMCNKEFESECFGISWSDDKKVAEKYVFFSKNNNIEKDGKVVWIDVPRDRVFAAWGVKGKKKEMIIL